jgi:hypothetical protein
LGQLLLGLQKLLSLLKEMKVFWHAYEQWELLRSRLLLLLMLVCYCSRSSTVPLRHKSLE